MDTQPGKGKSEERKQLRRLERLEQVYRALLASVPAGVLALDAQGVVREMNPAAATLWNADPASVVGKALRQGAIAERCEEMVRRFDAGIRAPRRTQCDCRLEEEGRVLSVSIVPVIGASGCLGWLICCEDASGAYRFRQLQQRFEGMSRQVTSGKREVQYAAREVQSTNQQLAAADAELSATTEDLAAARQALEDAGARLQALEAEMEERRRAFERQLSALLKQVCWPVLVLDEATRVRLCNPAAQRLLGKPAAALLGVVAASLPLAEGAGKAIARSARRVMETGKPAGLRERSFSAGTTPGEAQLLPLGRAQGGPGVLVTFLPDVRRSSQARRRGKRKKH